MDIEKALENIRKRGIEAVYFDTAAQAAEYLAGEISGKTVGFGGSVTAQQLGLFDLLGKKNTVLSHWTDSSPDIREKAEAAEVYISGANAIAETGEIVNIDGYGNRVAGTLSKKEAVYFIAGVNKLSPDLESAIFRARNIAAPKNAQRLGKKTPCAIKADHCYDCRSPERICRGLVITMGRMLAVDRMEVVLIGEDLGL